MKTMLRIAAFAVALSFLSGCTTTKYTFNNENYSSSADALSAHRSFLDKMLSELKVREKSIDKKVLVVTPNKSTIEAVGIKRTGTPKQEVIDFLAQHSETDFRFFYQALQKSKLFSQVESRLAEHVLKDARQEVDNYAAVVYLHLVSPTQVGWYMLKPGEDKPVQINIDALAKGTQRIESWVDGVETAYKQK